ncbi:MAG: GWxTD domain-containing protein [Candidatus Aminicenantes bacterium]
MKYLKTAFLICLGLTLSCTVYKTSQLDPQSRGFFLTARFIMTDEEKEIFTRLPDKKSRKEFIQEFWEKRDPDPSTEENEARKEFQNRVETANHYFKEGTGPGWKTDRGRIYLLLGPPDKKIQQPFLDLPSMKARIVWAYYQYRMAVEFVDRNGTGDFRINNYPVKLINAMEREKLLFSIKEEEKEEPADFQVEYKRDQQEIIISIPAQDLYYQQQDQYLVSDLQFEFFIYKEEGKKVGRFTREKQFKMLEEKVLDLEFITFTFPYKLKPGEYYVDVLVKDREGINKLRKIEKIKTE